MICNYFKKEVFFMKRFYLLFTAVLLAVSLLTGCGNKPAEAPASSQEPAASAESAAVEQEATPATEPAEAPAEPFRYEHDPHLNPTCMADVIDDPEAIYGFSPNPESARLGDFAKYDWSDAELVEKSRQDRIAYFESVQTMYDMLDEMEDQGEDIETIARALSAERNRLRLAAYEGDPDGLATVKASNLKKYGDENGPSADSLFEQYGDWETVALKSFSSNPGMDACLGLYDQQYPVYVFFGLVEE